MKLTAPLPPDPAYPAELVTIGNHIRKRRLELRLLQREVAAQIGVSTQMLQYWEVGRHQPAVRRLAAIVSLQGYAAAPAVRHTESDAELSERILGASIWLVAASICWQNACMAVQITVRNVPDRVRDALADQARHERKSMQEYLLGQFERLAERPSPAQWLARVRRRKAEAKFRLRPSEILSHRDADRR